MSRDSEQLVFDGVKKTENNENSTFDTDKLPNFSSASISETIVGPTLNRKRKKNEIIFVDIKPNDCNDWNGN